MTTLTSVPQRWWMHFRKFERKELSWLLVGFGACVLLFAFVLLAGEVAEGDTQALDVRVVTALRNPLDASQPIGPYWFGSGLQDITALGGPTVLGIVVFAVIGFLLLQTRYRTALFVFVTTGGGEILSYVLKHMFNRPRPSVLPHIHIMSPSFPSGHAMESAIVYLTLGATLMRVADRRLTKIYCLGLGALLTFLVGTSRVFLGVHYPTDVIGGWIIGFMWASICWLWEQRYGETTGIDAEKEKAS